jgi:hypothetical protein
MLRLCGVLSLSILFSPWLGAQDPPATDSHLGDLRPLVVSSQAKPGPFVVIPPITMARIARIDGKPKPAPKDAIDLAAWLVKQGAANGLESGDIRPWHIVIAYDQFDSDGDNFNSGAFEEFWLGPKSYKRIYKSWEFNQTEIATERGIFRQGAQRWPKPAELLVRSEVVAPFSYAANLPGFHGRAFERVFSEHKLQCIAVENTSDLSDPTQYCFEPGTSLLRYSHGDTWMQTVFNHLNQFQGRNVARELEVTDGGKPYLKLRVSTIELLPNIAAVDLTLPPDAVGPIGDRVSGVSVRMIKMGRLSWPASMRSQHFRVVLEILIGKNGRVISARGISGPPEAYKGCEDSVRDSTFQPYLVLGKPVEVEIKFECSQN